MSNNLVETISTKNSESIISLDFSKDGELLVAYKNNVVIFSEQPCPINSAIDNNNFCSCDSGFVLDSS